MNMQLVGDASGIRMRLLRQEEGRELNQAMACINLVACFEVILMGTINIFF